MATTLHARCTPWQQQATASRLPRRHTLVCSARERQRRDVSGRAARRERVLQQAAEVEALLQRMELGESEYTQRVSASVVGAAASPRMPASTPAGRPAGTVPRSHMPHSPSSSGSSSDGLASVGSLSHSSSSEDEGSDKDAGRLTAAPRFVAPSRPIRIPAAPSASSSTTGTPASHISLAGGAAMRSSQAPAATSQYAAYALPQLAVASCPADSIKVCTGKACMKRGSATLLASMQATAFAAGSQAPVTGCKCLGRCKKGPTVRVESARARQTVVYTQVGATSGAQIVLRHGESDSAARLAAAAQF